MEASKETGIGYGVHKAVGFGTKKEKHEGEALMGLFSWQEKAS